MSPPASRIDLDELQRSRRVLRIISAAMVLLGVLDVLALPTLLCHCAPDWIAQALMGRALVGVALVVTARRLARGQRRGRAVATGLCAASLVMAIPAPSPVEVLTMPLLFLVAMTYHPRIDRVLR